MINETETVGAGNPNTEYRFLTKYPKIFTSYSGMTTLGKKKVDCWSDKNKSKPRDVSIGTNKKGWFKCDKCPHEFESVLCLFIDFSLLYLSIHL